MALSDKLTAKLNEQITNEFNASQIYLAMACMFDNMALKMLSRWFRLQADEERGHALKIIDYLLSRHAKVEIGSVPKPSPEYPSVVAAVEAAYEHEQKVTRQFDDLMAQAEKDDDYASQNFLGWFVDEQVEEEESTRHLLEVARMAGTHYLQLEAYVAHLRRSEG